MKKLFFLLLLVAGITSCGYRTDAYTPEERSWKTTIEILDNIDSTKQISIVNDGVYVLENSLVIYHAQIDNSHVANLHSSMLLLVVVLLVVNLLIIILILND